MASYFSLAKTTSTIMQRRALNRKRGSNMFEVDGMKVIIDLMACKSTVEGFLWIGLYIAVGFLIGSLIQYMKDSKFMKYQRQDLENKARTIEKLETEISYES